MIYKKVAIEHVKMSYIQYNSKKIFLYLSDSALLALPSPHLCHYDYIIVMLGPKYQSIYR